MSAFTFHEVDKAVIDVGDVILHNDKEMTVGKDDIASSTFMGVSIFGDSYNSGYKKVLKGVLKNEFQKTRRS